MNTPWDQGLQSERTQLAWIRTTAMLAVTGVGCAGIALRVGTPMLAALPFVPAVFCAVLLLIHTGIRFRRVQEALHGGHPLDNRVDGLIVWLGTLAAVIGSFAFVLTRFGK
jgi:putative membrane protein